MKLYHWRSEALRSYDKGEIIAVGSNVKEARKNAKVAMKEKFSGKHYSKQRKLLKLDLKQEPDVLDAILLYGSD